MNTLDFTNVDFTNVQKGAMTKTTGGTEIQDLVEGTGKVAKPGRKVRDHDLCYSVGV